MSVTVCDIMRHVRNAFTVGCLPGDYALAGGHLAPGGLLLEGDWIAIRGSLRCDGVYQVGEGGCLQPSPPASETFTGAVYLLRPPADFLALCGEIIAWDAERASAGLKSERFGSYSYEAATDENGVPMSWQRVFQARLVPFRKMYCEEALPC
jgi:hypothetical protein